MTPTTHRATVVAFLFLALSLPGCIPTGSRIADPAAFESRARGQDVRLRLSGDSSLTVTGLHFTPDSVAWDGGGVPRSRLEYAGTTMNRDWASLQLVFGGLILGGALSEVIGNAVASPENAAHARSAALLFVLPPCAYLGYLAGQHFAPDDSYMP